jgi:hypothetical protein
MLRHVVYASLLHFGVESANEKRFEPDAAAIFALGIYYSKLARQFWPRCPMR